MNCDTSHQVSLDSATADGPSVLSLRCNGSLYGALEPILEMGMADGPILLGRGHFGSARSQCFGNSPCGYQAFKQMVNGLRVYVQGALATCCMLQPDLSIPTVCCYSLLPSYGILMKPATDKRTAAIS